MLILATILIIIGTMMDGAFGFIVALMGVITLISSVISSMKHDVKSKEMSVFLNSNDNNAVCPPHKWIYDTNGFLICSVCNKAPSDLLNEIPNRDA